MPAMRQVDSRRVVTSRRMRRQRLLQKSRMRCLVPVGYAVLLLFLFVPGCVAPEQDGLLDGSISAERLRTHVQELSDDRMQGRAPGTQGGQLAAQYIASRFRQAGLKPAVGDSSFFQHIDFVGIKSAPTMFFRSKDQFFRMIPGEQFVAWSKRRQTRISARNLPVVFMGFGIDAPEYRWNDYKDVDVHGKVLLMLVNEPASTDPSFFDGPALTYYGRWTYKFEQAARKGASGVILLHTDSLAGYGWNVVQNSGSKERVLLADSPGPQPLLFEGWMTLQRTEEVFRSLGLNLDSFVAKAYSSGFVPVQLPVTVTVSIQNEMRSFSSQNVIAKQIGTDPALRRQCLVYTAHYDHLGQNAPADSDAIFNGAFDNATGTAALLEIARAFANSPVPPKRSVIFAAVTAEESGLLGSAYYVRHPVFPLSETVANINLDGVNIWGRTKDLIARGAEKSTLLADIRAVAGDMNLVVAQDPVPGQGLYFRSDHFSFARAGVPAVFLTAGLTYIGRPEPWGRQKLANYVEKYYHTVDDEFRPDWDFRGAVQVAQVAFKTGLRLANKKKKPVWVNRSGLPDLRLN